MWQGSGRGAVSRLLGKLSACRGRRLSDARSPRAWLKSKKRRRAGRTSRCCRWPWRPCCRRGSRTRSRRAICCFFRHGRGHVCVVLLWQQGSKYASRQRYSCWWPLSLEPCRMSRLRRPRQAAHACREATANCRGADGVQPAVVPDSGGGQVVFTLAEVGRRADGTWPVHRPAARGAISQGGVSARRATP